MKKVLLLSVALAVVAGPAFAVTRDYPGTYVGAPTFTGYDDTLRASGPTSNGVGTTATYAVSGTAAVFCQLDTADASNRAVGTNVTITTNNGTASGSVAIDQFQGPGDHANAWFAHIDLSNSICNTNFTVTAKSTNGGLQGSSTANPGTQFTNKEGYTISARFGTAASVTTQASAATGAAGATLIANGNPAIGDFTIELTGAADTSLALLAGTYQDSVTITMTPAT